LLPALDVGLEVREQLFDRGERVVFLLVSDVPMVAFASLVVVANPTHTCGTEEQAVLVSVFT
jgi:hypothetical protein